MTRDLLAVALWLFDIQKTITVNVNTGFCLVHVSYRNASDWKWLGFSKLSSRSSIEHMPSFEKNACENTLHQLPYVPRQHFGAAEEYQVISRCVANTQGSRQQQSFKQGAVTWWIYTQRVFPDEEDLYFAGINNAAESRRCCQHLCNWFLIRPNLIS